MFDNVRAGNIAAVKEYLDFGGNVNVKDEPGNTLLHWAVNEDFQGSHREMVELLIANGADVNAVDNIQVTPLHMASNKGTAAILISKGANVNSKDHEGRTLVFGAARIAVNAPSQTWEMYLDLVQLLIGNDAELNTKDKSGTTPLHVVASSFDESKASKICELLLTNGANVNVINNVGQTFLDVAIFKKRSKTADLLRKYSGKTAEELKAPT
jgi:ankyrin repeat protein